MRARLFVFLSMLALAGAAIAADEASEQLLSKMRDAYKAVKVAKLDVAMTLTADEDEKLEATAKVVFGGEKKVRIEFLGKAPQGEAPTIFYIQDGKKMGIGPAADKLFYRDYDEEEFPLLLNLETLSFWQFDKQLSTKDGANMHDSELKVVEDVEWNDKKWTVLEETAKKSKVFVRYYIDAKTSLIWRCEVKDLETMKTQADISLKDLDVDAEAKDDDFKIEGTPMPTAPPPGDKPGEGPR